MSQIRVILSLLGFVSCALIAPFSASADDLPSVSELRRGCFERLGGQAKFDSLKTLRVSGNVDANAQRLPFKLFRKRPNLMRLIVEVDGLDVETVYNGEELASWVDLPDGSRQSIPLSPEMKEKTLELEGFESPFIQFSKDPTNTKNMGEEVIRGELCYKIRVDLSDGKTLDWNYVWISKETLRDWKFARYRDGREAGETYFSNYIEVDGIPVASESEEWLNGKLQQTVRVESVEFNVGLFDSFFRIRE